MRQRGREVGFKGEGTGGQGGGKWGPRGREAGIGYPPVHPHKEANKTNHYNQN